MQERIAVVTTSRADYGHLYWPIREIEAHPDLAHIEGCSGSRASMSHPEVCASAYSLKAAMNQLSLLATTIFEFGQERNRQFVTTAHSGGL